MAGEVAEFLGPGLEELLVNAGVSQGRAVVVETPSRGGVPAGSGRGC